MTNRGMVTIYAFVYLKILPLFTETRKMGIVQQEAAWEGQARLSLLLFSPCWVQRGPACHKMKLWDPLCLPSPLTGKSPLGVQSGLGLPEKISPLSCPYSTEWQCGVKNAAIVQLGMNPAFFLSQARLLEQFIKTTLELRGWVGVKRGEKVRKLLKPGLQQVPFICVLSKGTWAAPCRNPERMKADVW
jgi:hypothetical protein